MDFSSQAGLRKVPVSENLLVLHVCGHARGKISPDVLHQILL